MTNVTKDSNAAPGDEDSGIGKAVRESIYKSTREKVEAIWYASLDGDVDRVRELLKEGNHDANGLNRWQVDSDPNGWQRAPLHAAALKDHIELAEFLISEGADVNAQTKYKDTPLHFAVAQGDLKMVRQLVEHGARADVKNDDDESPVDLAEKKGDAQMLDELAKADGREGSE